MNNISYFKISQIFKIKEYKKIERDLANEPYYKSYIDKNIVFNLSAIIKVGTRVIMWNDNPDEVQELTKEELFKRLYVVGKFNNRRSDFVYFKHHTKASENYDMELVPNNLNCLIENRDFKINELGNIEWL